MKLNPTLLADFYKLSHKDQYPKNTKIIYSTWTCRNSRVEGIDSTVMFGLQGFIKEILIEYFRDNFFQAELEDVLEQNKEAIEGGLGIMNPDLSHIEALWNLGYLPLRIDALLEGTSVPIRVPSFTVQNTLPDFFWLTNGLETLISTETWSPITTATIAREYRRILDGFAMETTGSTEGVDFQAHDFSMRGMCGFAHAAKAGCGHLLSFLGTDCIPSMFYLRDNYSGVMAGGIGGSIPATEHSVQCANMPDDQDETETIKRMITEVYPAGLVSMVLDTNDFWKNVTEVLPAIKDIIMERDGKFVVRPDCYDDETSILTHRGWVLFKDLLSEDYVAQVMDDETFELVKPQGYIEQDYKGQMVCFKDSKGKLDLRVTPNHRMIYKKRGEWVVQEAEKCTTKGYHTKDILRSSVSIDSRCSLSPMERLKIAFQADGSYVTKSKSKIRFSFSKERKITRLNEIIENCHLLSKRYDLKDGKSEIQIEVDVTNFKKEFSWVDTFDMCSNWCKEFIEELSYWDATRRSDCRFKFDTTNKSVMDVVELIAMSAGYGILISKNEDNRKEIFSDVYTAHIMKDNHLGGQSIKKSVEYYEGKVYCVKVPTGRLIVKRNRGTAVCGNSGDPVDIVCGTWPGAGKDSGAEQKGLIQVLYEIFGGTTNEQGYKVLDEHIGAIYGDSITLERATQICQRLKDKGFASTNIVLGVGSFSYAYHTRDTFGMAFKSTYALIDNDEKLLSKDPKTDNGTKKSAKGMVAVVHGENGEFTCVDGLDALAKTQLSDKDLLVPVYCDGYLLVDQTLEEIRERVKR